MKWNNLFNDTQRPTVDDVNQFIGQGSDLWLKLLSYIESTYNVQPKMSYSKCAAQPGWNIKYQKSGKSLCTLYPMEGYFIALVVVGAKEETEVEMMLGTFTQYIKDLYSRTTFACGGRWLMVEVKDTCVLGDVKRLIAARVKPK
ncbi:DUF3788 domain-containing protein [Pseudobacteroides cellulosolvens]|uniref:DUF3788 domain-containing protein n=1 Tax=Pseudobacteroides cellulosolvens ATCC 35603 = DSM 2933 TaxID=398512 RepID=A0A0L6JQK0_9FIRM|nr:DUF3788 domain-containing protein [Pseudobacteroides cellulosolvens]KNY28116.1 Protein of unknown function DUF3788 [Pseudobacteroides cellulosolvens ATCC 35603 = DSM 2933]